MHGPGGNCTTDFATRHLPGGSGCGLRAWASVTPTMAPKAKAVERSFTTDMADLQRFLTDAVADLAT